MKHHGLSLIELLIVIAIMAAAAGMAISLVDRVDTSARYQETARRLGEIRSAILGPDAITPTGELMSGGYVQDVGRLPEGPRDLLGQWNESTNCIDPPDGLPKLTYSSKWRTWYGWRGPYVTTPPLREVDRKTGRAIPPLFDDYGNEFSWSRGSGTNDYLAVRSLGADGIAGGTGVYDADYPDEKQPLIPQDDWISDLRGLQVEMANYTNQSFSGFVFRVIVPRWDQDDPLGYWPAVANDDFVGLPQGATLPAATFDSEGDMTAPAVRDFAFGDGIRSVRIPHGRRMLFMVDGTTGQPIAFNGQPICAELIVSRKVSPSKVKLVIRD